MCVIIREASKGIPFIAEQGGILMELFKKFYFIEANSKQCIGTEHRFTAPKVGQHVWIPLQNTPTPFIIGKVFKDIAMVSMVEPLDLE